MTNDLKQRYLFRWHLSLRSSETRSGMWPDGFSFIPVLLTHIQGRLCVEEALTLLRSDDELKYVQLTLSPFLPRSGWVDGCSEGRNGRSGWRGGWGRWGWFLLQNNLTALFCVNLVLTILFCFPQDTDSLMEWWYTVERESQPEVKHEYMSVCLFSINLLRFGVSEWDEVPSDEEHAAVKEDESKCVFVV